LEDREKYISYKEAVSIIASKTNISEDEINSIIKCYFKVIRNFTVPNYYFVSIRKIGKIVRKRKASHILMNKVKYIRSTFLIRYRTANRKRK